MKFFKFKGPRNGKRMGWISTGECHICCDFSTSKWVNVYSSSSNLDEHKLYVYCVTKSCVQLVYKSINSQLCNAEHVQYTYVVFCLMYLYVRTYTHTHSLYSCYAALQVHALKSKYKAKIELCTHLYIHRMFGPSMSLIRIRFAFGCLSVCSVSVKVG